jgi:uncharacterized RDD family membrane protein YckC
MGGFDLASASEVNWDSGMFRGAERAAIVIATILLGLITAIVFAVEKTRSAGWIVAAISGGLVLLLVVFHLLGGFARLGPATAKPPGMERPIQPISPSDVEIASLQVRSMAFVADLGVLFVAFAVIAGIGKIADLPEVANVIFLVVGLTAAFLIRPLTTWITDGRTFGRWLFGIRVIRADGEPMTLARALQRESIRSQFNDDLWALLDVYKASTDHLNRSFPDQWTRTLVVLDKRNTPTTESTDQANTKESMTPRPHGRRAER